MTGAIKSTAVILFVVSATSFACFPDLEATDGSLTVGLLGVDPAVDSVRIGITVGPERFEVTETLTPAATVRIDLVPVGAVSILAETFSGTSRLQSKGINGEIGPGENEIPIDFGSAGANPPTTVRSAEQRLTVELSDGSIAGGQLAGEERIDRDAFLAFVAAARASFQATPRVARVDAASVTIVDGSNTSLDALFSGPVSLALVSEDGAAAVTVGSLTPTASGTAMFTVTGTDLSPLSGDFMIGRFGVRLTGPSNLSSVRSDLTIALTFVAER